MGDDSDIGGSPEKKNRPQPVPPASKPHMRQRPDRRPEKRRQAGPVDAQRRSQSQNDKRDDKRDLDPNARNQKRNKGQFQRQRNIVPEKPQEPRNVVQYVCPLCGKPILDLASALGNRGTGEPVHFDCVLEALSSEEKLAENEKLTYLGAGFFAVIVYKNGRDGSFTVSRKIRWEDENEKLAWRKDISSSLSNL
ncbi:MAG TPA: hypothetical protein PLT87_03360 [Spirochaetales bacterium]|nr:hypothetical protein [Spirochaetales bacterium]